jgi:hypothetical protein
MSSYRFECLEILDSNGVDIPTEQPEELTGWREQQAAKCHPSPSGDADISEKWTEEMKEQIWNLPMMREVRDIVSSKGAGKPHWAIEY